MPNNDFANLLQTLNIRFKDGKILQQAFIHRSYLNEFHVNSLSNERLEFLGDSVLSLVVSNKLFNLRQKDAEGELTNLRAHIVKTTSLAQAAKKLKLGGYLKLSKNTLIQKLIPESFIKLPIHILRHFYPKGRAERFK